MPARKPNFSVPVEQAPIFSGLLWQAFSESVEALAIADPTGNASRALYEKLSKNIDDLQSISNMTDFDEAAAANATAQHIPAAVRTLAIAIDAAFDRIDFSDTN